MEQWSAQLKQLPTLEEMAEANSRQRKGQGVSAAQQPAAVRCVYVVLSNALLKWHDSRADCRQGQAVTFEKKNAGRQEKRSAGKLKDASRFGQLGG